MSHGPADWPQTIQQPLDIPVTEKPRQRRRLAITLTLLVLLSAAITFATSWTIVLIDAEPTSPPFHSSIVSGADDHPYFGGSAASFGFQRWSLQRAPDGELKYPPIPAWVDLPTSRQVLASSSTSAFGWPLLCVKYHSDWYSPQTKGSFLWARGNPNSPKYKQYCFPLTILPARFAANTALNFATLLAIFAALPVTRRILRHRRGQCLRCGYDRKGLPPESPCPECGTGLPPCG